MNHFEVIKELYSKVSDALDGNKVDLYFAIIQLKNADPNLRNIKQSKYIDIKCFINFYIRSRVKRDFGYDIIDANKIIRAIDFSDSPKEKHELYIWTIRILKKNHFESESEYISLRIRQIKLEIILSQRKSLVCYAKAFMHLTSYNFWTIFITLLFLFTLSYLLLLPAFDDRFVLFDIKYQIYSSNFYFNHFLNMLAKTFELSRDIKIIPQNWLGVLLLVLLKAFYLIFIINYLYKNILYQFKISK